MRSIQLLLTDVDGVLTDGSLTFDSQGHETKSFHVHDGLGVRLWQRAGGAIGIVTGRASTIVENRAKELDIEIVFQAVKEKLPVVEQIAKDQGLELDQVAYIGDDLPDLQAVQAVGFGCAVADAAPELIAAADFVTTKPGGRGALREVIEKLLKDSDRWDAATGPLHG